jgi:hypothetical protein
MKEPLDYRDLRKDLSQVKSNSTLYSNILGHGYETGGTDAYGRPACSRPAQCGAALSYALKNGGESCRENLQEKWLVNIRC